MYAAARLSAKSDVKFCVNAAYLYLGDTLEKVQIFDSILVQVGPVDKLEHESGYDLDNDAAATIPPLRLTLSYLAKIGNYQIGRFQVDQDLGSERNYGIARSWLTDCNNSHLECLSGTVAELPTRVVDIQPTDIVNSDSVRVVHSQGQRAEYAALSHCWGGEVSCLLTAKTSKQFQKAIPLPTLSPNFRDAITITRKLGFRYIWIDSLCILQDSGSDWKRESGKMGLVYRNSSVTISAMASPRSTHGILKCNQTSLSPQPVTMRLFQDKSNNAIPEVRIERSDLEEENLRVLDQDSPLASRGWALQELMLSPRHLFYGSNQIYWRCPKGFKSADGFSCGTKFPDNTSYSALTTVFHSDILRQTVPTLYEPRTVLRDYYNLVQDYSSRRLTLGSDKLPAVSGLAGRLHLLLGGVYLAGLWSCDLKRGLLWRSEVGSCKHVKTYRAPSWSWAVTDQPITFMIRNLTPSPLDIVILASHVTLRDNTYAYGEVLSGHIIAEGRTIQLLRSTQVIHPRLPEGYSGLVQFDQQEDGEIFAGPVMVFLMKTGSEFRLLSIQTQNGDREDWEVDYDSIFPIDYTCIIVLANYPDESSMEGLVLQKVSGEAEEAYERVGQFTLRVEPELVENWPKQTVRLI
ncbi:MAG: hypothetical protein M1822_003736 [Bathelium mastoideum]|nr:MAG: hypothetical protein M1822_003736 [Bathelium mastoideum]